MIPPTTHSSPDSFNRVSWLLCGLWISISIGYLCNEIQILYQDLWFCAVLSYKNCYLLIQFECVLSTQYSPLFSSEYPEFSLLPMLLPLPTLFSSSMMVARLLLWLAGDSGPGQIGAGDDTEPEVLTPECGNKLVREREAATAPHSCNILRIKYEEIFIL